MATRQTVIADVAALVAGAQHVRGVLTISEYVGLALRDVEQVRPRNFRRTITGDGTDEYPLAEPWERGFSIIEQVRWVSGADFNAPAQWLDKDSYEVEYARTLVSSESVGTGDGATRSFALDEDFATADGAVVTVNAVTQAATAYTIDGNENGSRITFTTAPTTGHAIVATYYTVTPQIRFALSPSTSDRVVIEHTARHTLSDYAETTTISETEASAVARRAAAFLLRAAAASVNTTPPQATDMDFAEGVSGVGAEFRRLAEENDREYRRLLGLDEEQSAPSAFVSVSATHNSKNWRYLTHPRRGASWQE